MKKLGFIIMSILFLSCESTSTPKDFFEQVLGNWQRVNEEPGLRTFENWQKDQGTITGVAYTLQGNDTVFKENLRILEKEDKNWFLEVKSPEEPPVLFKITDYSQTNLTAENPKNNFPQRVAYSFKNDTLTAVISGGDKPATFTFIKIEDN